MDDTTQAPDTLAPEGDWPSSIDQPQTTTAAAAVGLRPDALLGVWARTMLRLRTRWARRRLRREIFANPEAFMKMLADHAAVLRDHQGRLDGDRATTTRNFDATRTAMQQQQHGIKDLCAHIYAIETIIRLMGPRKAGMLRRLYEQRLGEFAAAEEAAALKAREVVATVPAAADGTTIIDASAAIHAAQVGAAGTVFQTPDGEEAVEDDDAAEVGTS